MKRTVQRSLLILPVHVRRFVEKAHLRGADVIILDLEDAVPPPEKEKARSLVQESLALASRGGGDVFVRVNTEFGILHEDLEAAVWPGLYGIFLPKVESSEDVVRAEEGIARFEQVRGMQPLSVKMSVHIESPKGFLKIHEIASAGKRIESMSLGIDDYCLELGVEPSEEGYELLLAFCMMVNVCSAWRINPVGVLGTVAGFDDLEGFENSAQRGRRLGSTGGYCIHPGQVGILNRVFSPSEANVAHARRVVEVFEEGLREGRAAVSMDGRMVDTPIYKRALALLELAQSISEKESQKAAALEALKS